MNDVRAASRPQLSLRPPSRPEIAPLACCRNHINGTSTSSSCSAGRAMCLTCVLDNTVHVRTDVDRSGTCYIALPCTLVNRTPTTGAVYTAAVGRQRVGAVQQSTVNAHLSLQWYTSAASGHDSIRLCCDISRRWQSAIETNVNSPTTGTMIDSSLEATSSAVVDTDYRAAYRIITVLFCSLASVVCRRL